MLALLHRRQAGITALVMAILTDIQAIGPCGAWAALLVRMIGTVFIDMLNFLTSIYRAPFVCGRVPDRAQSH